MTALQMWCQAGEHFYMRERKRGRTPTNCPEHKPPPGAAQPPANKRLADVLANPRAATCRCGITEATTAEELRAMGSGCTAPTFVCPTLDAARKCVKAIEVAEQ